MLWLRRRSKRVQEEKITEQSGIHATNQNTFLPKRHSRLNIIYKSLSEIYILGPGGLLPALFLTLSREDRFCDVVNLL